MKKIIGILLSVALMVTMMPVCSIAASSQRTLTATPTAYLEAETFGTNTFFMGKGDARTFLFSAGSINSAGELQNTWLGPKAGNFNVYKLSTNQKTGKEVQTLLDNPPFKFTYNVKLDMDMSQLKGLKPVTITLNKYVPYGTVYRVQYTGKIGSSTKKCTSGFDSIYFIASNFKNAPSAAAINFSVNPSVSSAEIPVNEQLPVTGEKLYLYDVTSGSPVHWDINTAKAKVYNEYNTNVTSKFEIAKDENGVYVKTDKKIYGFFQLVYNDGAEYGTAIFAVNGAEGLLDAKATTTQVKAKVAKKKVTLNLSRKGNFSQDGYQIYKSTKKTSGFKKLASTTKSSYVDKNVKAKKTYYYKIRTYKIFNGTYYYSKWSKVIKVKAK